MATLSLDNFKKWLDKYGQVWQDRDPKATSELYSQNVKYYESPFDAPMVGQDAIYQYARGAEQTQKNVQFSYQILAVKENFGIAQWQTNFVRVSSGNHVKLDGILLAKFDDKTKCSEFREWWHRQEINARSSDT